ncbi:unnamed protein product [Protopolystoma xenopodis]|uniref:Uncharacterized protein n=1 Tax=Protopolystoma xenopodis TaxID=117903 RepID=A0A3S5AE56_9PLAT|nr:unnamed protein product [Protopolystoma xenopodis]
MPAKRLGMYQVHSPTLEMVMHTMDSGKDPFSILPPAGDRTSIAGPSTPSVPRTAIYQSTAGGSANAASMATPASQAEFAFYLLHSHLIPSWTVPLLLHSLTFPGSMFVFWRLVEFEFSQADWRVRFDAIEKAGLLLAEMDDLVLTGHFSGVAKDKVLARKRRQTTAPDLVSPKRAKLGIILKEKKNIYWFNDIYKPLHLDILAFVHLPISTAIQLYFLSLFILHRNQSYLLRLKMVAQVQVFVRPAEDLSQEREGPR